MWRDVATAAKSEIRMRFIGGSAITTPAHGIGSFMLVRIVIAFALAIAIGRSPRRRKPRSRSAPRARRSSAPPSAPRSAATSRKPASTSTSRSSTRPLASCRCLRTNQLQVVEGGLTANLFNGILQGLPVKIGIDTTSSPIGHNLMVRYDLKDEIKKVPISRDAWSASMRRTRSQPMKSPRYWRAAASTGATSNPKSFRFRKCASRSPPRRSTRGLLITPYTAQLPEQNLAVRWIDVDESPSRSR